MKRVLLLILLAMAILPGKVRSQAGTVTYSGQIHNSGGDAIDYATVVLLQGDRQIAGGTTDDAGDFALKADRGDYTLIIQCIGYETERKQLRLSAPTRETFILQPAAYALKEVVVQAREIERKADRFIVNISPTSGKDGTELLSQAPGVWLSDDQISINGASGTKVFVNNREIKLTGEELLSYLRSLKSEDIRQIEVIPVAGAEYDASTRGGVIRIALRRRQDNGVQGNILMGTAVASSLNRYMPSASLNARMGKWNINAAASGIFTPKDKSDMNSIRSYTTDDTRFSSLSRFENRSNYGTGRLGITWDADTLNSFGAEIEYIGQGSKANSYSRTELVKGNFPVNSMGEYFQRNEYNTFTATANYLHKLDNQGSLIKLIVDYAGKKSTGNNDYFVLRQAMGGQSDTTYRSNADATYDIVTSDLSLSRYLKKGMSLKAGIKYTFTDVNDNSCYEGLSGQLWEPNPAYGYVLNYRENIVGGYGSFSAGTGRWSFVAGLRGEYTRTSNRNDNIRRDYFDLFPNLNVSYAFNNLKTSMLVGQYSRNIERPAFHSLSPNHIQLSDYSYQIGNPYLKPTYINRFNLTWVYQYRYTVTVGGNLHHNLIREFCKQDANDPDISYITPENHSTENHWFIAVNLPFQPVRWCNLTANFIGVKQDIRMSESAALAKHYLMFANATATFYLPAGYNMEIQYGGASRLYSGNSEVAPRHTLGFTLRKKFMNERLLVTAGVNNIFNRYNNYVNNLDAYKTESHYKEGSAGRIFKVSLSWSFNSGKKVAKKTIERSSESEFNRLKEK